MADAVSQETREKLARFAKLRDEEQRRIKEWAIRYYAPIRDGGRLTHKGPSPKQASFHDARPESRLRIYTGGNQSGKTTAGCAEVVAHMLGYRPWLPEDHPNHKVMVQDGRGGWKPITTPNTGIICTSTFNTVRRIHWPRLFGDSERGVPGMLPQEHGKKIQTRTNVDGVVNYFKIPQTGSEAHILTYDQKDQLYEGWTVDWVMFDEPCSHNKYIAAERGLLARLGNMWMTMTLIAEPWIEMELLERKDVFHIEVSTEDNVGYGMSKHAFNQWYGKLRPEERDARLLGKSQHLTGRVYKEFDHNIHILNREKTKLDPDWVWYMHVDPHVRKPHVAVWVCVTPENKLIGAGELMSEGQHLISEFQQDILRYERDVLGIDSKYIHRIIDPFSQYGVRTGEGLTVIDEFKKYGMYFKVGSKSRQTAIHLMHERLSHDWPRKAPGFFIFDDMPLSKKEFQYYIYDEHVGRGVEERKGKKEEPRKKWDDAIEGFHRILLENPRFIGVLDEDDDEDAVSWTRRRATGTQSGY